MARRIFLDLDGVLADFDGHYERCFGARPDRSRPDPPGFWENISRRGTFFLDLSPMPDAMNLWQGCVAMAGQARLTILTGIPRRATYRQAEAHKRAWVARHIGPDAPVICCLSEHKWRHGAPGDILVDDWERYRHLWEEMGGVFVHHTATAASLARLAAVLEGGTHDVGA